MKQFRKYGWQWTTWACGRALEVTQPYPKMMIEDGHEVSLESDKADRLHAMVIDGGSMARMQKRSALISTNPSTDYKLPPA